MSQASEAATSTKGVPRRGRRAPLSEEAPSEGARAERRLGWLLCAPALVVMAAVAGYPILYAGYLSLRRYDLRFPANQAWVGLANYAAVLSSPFWWRALAVTLVITVVSVGLELVLGLLLALLMHRAVFGKGAVRTALLVPYGIVTVAAAFSWFYAWTPGTGYLAHLLPAGSAPLTNQWTAVAVIILAEVWKTTPFVALLLLAGLALVPEELLNAARVDGASGWQRFTGVMLPVLKPVILVALLFRTLDAFRVFDNIYVLTRGAHDTRSVSILGYDNLFNGLNLGIGSAISVLILGCVALIAFALVKGFGAAVPGADTEEGR